MRIDAILFQVSGECLRNNLLKLNRSFNHVLDPALGDRHVLQVLYEIRYLLEVHILAAQLVTVALQDAHRKREDGKDIGANDEVPERDHGLEGKAVEEECEDPLQDVAMLIDLVFLEMLE